jgi:hypothetical protein
VHLGGDGAVGLEPSKQVNGTPMRHNGGLPRW